MSADPFIPRKAAGLLLLALFLAVGMRYAGLERVPAGFYVDEAAIAAQVLCLNQTGRSAQGQAWPLYAPVLGGGQASPSLLYPAVAWVRLGGDSIASLRALGVSLGLLMIGALAWAANPRQGAPHSLLLSVALGLLYLSNPWWFTATRVFWDPVFGAAFWGLGLALYWHLRRDPQPSAGYALALCLAVVLLVAAAYAYPPIRIQLLLSLLILAIGDRRHLRQVGLAWLPAALLGTLLLIPLLFAYLQAGEFAGRGQMLAIWSPTWLQSQGLSYADLPGLLLHNLSLHLDPGYWFLYGDSNLRHSVGFGGLLGPAEVAAVLVVLAMLPAALSSRDSLLLAALFIAGLVPAALTWEGLPHALRSLGAAGPLLLWIGVLLAALDRQLASHPLRRALILVSVLACLSMLRFGIYYFGNYPSISQPWFAGEVAPQDYSDEFALARLYYALRQGQGACDLAP